MDALLATPGFAGSVLDTPVCELAANLSLLDRVVGVTVAGPVIMNDVGVHSTPGEMGGPLRSDDAHISLRINPARLGKALVTEPAAHVPPTLRIFDADGNTAHATYLTEHSDRLAFEALSLVAPQAGTDAAPSDAGPPEVRATGSAPSSAPDDDQIALFDALLDDGGAGRLTRLAGPDAAVSSPSLGSAVRVDVERVIPALEHAALLGMPVTLCAVAAGCLQMRHAALDGCREHNGTMVIASGTARVMINFNLVEHCWITWTQGACGRTGAIELYDRHGRCSLVATQTGPVATIASEAWDQLISDLAA
ncbi:heme transporter [Gordonia amarae]|uniref:Heme transporter n=1 Tax=Gordonia amarae TaxID=36821 RepID=A0A857L3Q0_9ACTN|nr:heme transporter [Gordonia amarae]QHN24273.1 heme transporter [Gordonia amarae]QHN33192.1 heme transporter [Gordonia amarae]QHN41915.1 heme transporter [Gordonia amarae]